MAFSIPTSDWKEAQEIAKGKEFKPKFDVIEPKKPYYPNYYEWLFSKGKKYCQDFLLTSGGSSTTTISSGSVFFLTSWTITTYTAGAAVGYVRVYLNTTNDSLHSEWVTSNTPKTVTQNYSYPLRLNAGEILGVNSSAANVNANFSYQGFLVNAEYLKEI